MIEQQLPLRALHFERPPLRRRARLGARPLAQLDEGERIPPRSQIHPDLRRLGTEQILASATDLDRKSSLEIVRLINDEDATIAVSVRRALPQIARAIDAACWRPCSVSGTSVRPV